MMQRSLFSEASLQFDASVIDLSKNGAPVSRVVQYPLLVILAYFLYAAISPNGA